MRTDAIFRIASQSKAIVSVAAMTLVEEGKLLLTDPVGKYLPEFMETKVAVARDGGGYDIVKAARPITVRDLLTHTSGFGYGTGVGGELWTAAGQTGYYFADKDETIRDSVRRIATLPAHAQPGTQWIYGYNTDILGALVEVVAGKPLDAVLRERIFEPLGMRDTEFYLSPGKNDRFAAVYSMNDGKLERAPTPGNAVGQGHYVEGPRKTFSGGAGLLSTVTDYARFLQMVLDGGALDDRRILSRKTVELMTTSHLGDVSYNAGQGFGLGFYVVEDLGERGSTGLRRRVRLGRRLSHDVLGRSARGARRRAHDAARAGRHRRRSSEGSRARLSSDRRLSGARHGAMRADRSVMPRARRDRRGGARVRRDVPGPAAVSRLRARRRGRRAHRAQRRTQPKASGLSRAASIRPARAARGSRRSRSRPLPWPCSRSRR